MEALLGRHYERVHTICRRLAGNDADADDACQEALLAIVRGLARFDSRSSFSTWSYRVASNACLDEMRRRNRRPALLPSMPERPGSGPGIETTVTDRVTLADALPRLPEEFRVPVVLRDVAGLDYAEIAETLGIPPGTVRSRIARGRRQLSDLVGNQVPPGGRQR
jgi:RNA polymerase sigma-70 factor, ECF subfamily